MTYRPKDTKERITHRLKIAQGNLRKIIDMVASDDYCIDILHQTGALQKALKEIDNVILENHLQSCVSDSIRKGNSEEAIQEVMNVFRKRP